MAQGPGHSTSTAAGSTADQPQQLCPVCEQPGARIYIEHRGVYLSSNVIGASRKDVSAGTILRCTHCGHGFQQGSFSDAELAALYRTMDATRYEAEEGFRKITAQRHARMIPAPKRRGARLLDVGCASGLFLVEVKKRGWLISGVEPNAELVVKARERLGQEDLQAAVLAEAHLEPNSFDVITSWDVLEHIAVPHEFLRDCARLLRPDGVLWLKVPDIDSLIARLMGARWPMYLPEHLGYFNRQSLGKCASRVGLRLTQVTRQAVTFSAGYVFYRLEQHRIPMSSVGRKLAEATGLARIPLPLRLGEMYACLVIESRK